ncbi:MAG: inositol monophosphatase [Deltaproteobacteria bacterium]|nr:inositol monophosphatase [Deltaproteobacteria bacterium]MBW2641958.1 inositol monophosphatase [Deltaproteobacteria bacterium]
MDLEHAKRIGIAAAYKGQGVLLSHYGRVFKVNKKGAFDLITEADTGSEKRIIATIEKAFPDHTILSEESGLNKGTADHKWIVDPLDGTTNFAHQLGLFSISIAFSLSGDTVIGVVLSPVTGELFTAVKGKGAKLNGRPIKVSNSQPVSESLLVTGFPYDLIDCFNPLMTRFSKCLKASQGVRRLGSAAMDLCFVACGRFDGFWEQNLKPWDTAAGELIAREAGAIITDFSNKPFDIYKNEILATNGKIHKEMLSLLELKDLA